MSRYALRLPDSLFEAAKALAEQEHTSLNQLFVIAIAEKVSALRTESYFRERAAQADEAAFAAVLEKIKQRGGSIVPGDEMC
jgi:hypothetical protein